MEMMWGGGSEGKKHEKKTRFDIFVKKKKKVWKHFTRWYLKADGCVGEEGREREERGRVLGAVFMALPANSREVTLGRIQDKGLHADGAKHPSSPQRIDADWQYCGEESLEIPL